jgi:hypothetical protein
MIVSFNILKPFVTFVAAAALLLLPLGAPATGAAPSSEQLIVFVQPGPSEVDRVFQSEQLPAIREVASDLGCRCTLARPEAARPRKSPSPR